MDNHRGSDKDASRAESPAGGVSRRRLLRKAGWTVPVVIAVTVPMDAHAQMSTGESSTSHQSLPGNDPGFGPEDAMAIAGTAYSGRQLLLLLKDDDDNPTRRLVRQLIIVKASSARGDQLPAAVQKVVELAEERLSTYGPLYPDPPPPKNTQDRRDFLAWARVLEEYNKTHSAHLSTL